MTAIIAALLEKKERRDDSGVTRCGLDEWDAGGRMLSAEPLERRHKDTNSKQRCMVENKMTQG
jgi:hypothetical protein